LDDISTGDRRLECKADMALWYLSPCTGWGGEFVKDLRNRFKIALFEKQQPLIQFSVVVSFS